MRKIILILAACAALLVAVPAPTTQAGGLTQLTNCKYMPVLQNRICLDISRSQIYVYTNAGPFGDWTTAQYSEIATSTLATPPSPPTQGWVAYDSECNADANNVTKFYSSAYGQVISIGIWNYTTHPWYIGDVSQNMKDIVAWLANSNAGYECVIVP